MTIRSIARLRDGPLISRRRERAMAEDWVGRMKVRTDGIDRLLTTLSGGNQQKVLFARALATDAPIIFLDGSMRGVDVGTKQEVYRMIREQAGDGRCFVWFTSFLQDRPLIAVVLLAAGIAAYAAAGVLIQVRSLPSIIVTLGMPFVWLGLALLVLPSPGGTAPDRLTGPWLCSRPGFRCPSSSRSWWRRWGSGC